MSERLTLSEELDRERMRLAACGVAANGGTVDGMDTEYDSDSLQAVLHLRAKLAARDAEWRAAVERVREEYAAYREPFAPSTILDALLAAMEVPHDGQ